MIQILLAKADLKHHWQQNSLFVLASSLMIAINYIFLSLMANHSLADSSYGKVIINLLALGKNFTLIVAIFFYVLCK